MAQEAKSAEKPGVMSSVKSSVAGLINRKKAAAPKKSGAERAKEADADADRHGLTGENIAARNLEVDRSKAADKEAQLTTRVLSRVQDAANDMKLGESLQNMERIIKMQGLRAVRADVTLAVSPEEETSLRRHLDSLRAGDGQVKKAAQEADHIQDEVDRVTEFYKGKGSKAPKAAEPAPKKVSASKKKK